MVRFEGLDGLDLFDGLDGSDLLDGLDGLDEAGLLDFRTFRLIRQMVR